MGDTHFRSNIKAKNGTETISGFASVGGTVLTATGAVSGATVTATGAASGATVVATSYVKVGSNKYVFQGGDVTQASLIAIIEALVATPLDKQGSLYLGDTKAWRLSNNFTATRI